MGTSVSKELVYFKGSPCWTTNCVHSVILGHRSLSSLYEFPDLFSSLGFLSFHVINTICHQPGDVISNREILDFHSGDMTLVFWDVILFSLLSRY